MSSNGQHREGNPGQVLNWPGRVVTAQDLQRQLNGHKEIIVTERAILTPSAIEYLRAGGIRVTRRTEAKAVQAAWGVAADQPQASIDSAVQALGREGMRFKALDTRGHTDAVAWARCLAECIARGECQGGVVFCADPGLVCCVANKLAGLRAAVVATAAQAGRASRALGVNFAAVEMPGRTFFEVRQILRMLCASAIACPVEVAATLQELDGHAHR